MKTHRKATSPRTSKAPTKAAIRRAVASSTAIETGQSIARIERSLRSPSAKARRLALAR